MLSAVVGMVLGWMIREVWGDDDDVHVSHLPPWMLEDDLGPEYNDPEEVYMILSGVVEDMRREILRKELLGGQGNEGGALGVGGNLESEEGASQDS